MHLGRQWTSPALNTQLYPSTEQLTSDESVGCDQVINLCREYDEMIADYEALTSDLLEWIRKTIEILNNRDFPNSLAGVQNMLSQFNSYRTLEKPPKLASFIYSQQHILFHRCKHLKELIGEIGHAH